nr:phosphoglycerate kinase [Chromatium okenii]
MPIKNGKVTSDARITASMPTFEHCIKAGAKVMVMSHLGRPEEGVFSEEDSLKPSQICSVLRWEVRFV